MDKQVRSALLDHQALASTIACVLQRNPNVREIVCNIILENRNNDYNEG